MPAEIFIKRYFQLPRAEIGQLRFILESYDGLAFARTLDSAHRPGRDCLLAEPYG